MNLLTSMRYLAALNEHRHFGRAALACHITQPALSNALRALEEEFGTVIVRRGRSFAGFTPEGDQVLATALAMLRAEEGLRQELSAAAGALRGQLRMAAVPTGVGSPRVAMLSLTVAGTPSSRPAGSPRSQRASLSRARARAASGRSR